MSFDHLPEPKRVLLRLLRQARAGAGVTQIDMAAALGLQQADVSKIERGVRGIDVLECRSWAEAVGVPFEAFAALLDEELRNHAQVKKHLGQRLT